jgi:hypothetical protein
MAQHPGDPGAADTRTSRPGRGGTGADGYQRLRDMIASGTGTPCARAKIAGRLKQPQVGGMARYRQYADQAAGRNEQHDRTTGIDTTSTAVTLSQRGCCARFGIAFC